MILTAIEALKLKVPQNMADCFALIERGMLAGPWVLGAAYSVRDAYLSTITRWLAGDGVDVARFPGVSAHAQRMGCPTGGAKGVDAACRLTDCPDNSCMQNLLPTQAWAGLQQQHRGGRSGTGGCRQR
jgi:hypothetical protein